MHDKPGVDLHALHEGHDRLVMTRKYALELARSEHTKGAALADLLSTVEGKLSSRLDVQALAPHPAENAHMGVP